MRSRKLQALAFIKSYWAQWGQSPSHQEIASHLGVSKQRVKNLVAQLEKDGAVVRTSASRRNIALPPSGEALTHADMLLKLAAAGYQVMEGEVILFPVQPPLSKPALPRPADLDYDPKLG